VRAHLSVHPFFTQTVRFVVLAAFLATAAAIPFRVTAQTSAQDSALAAQPTPVASSTVKPEAAKPEEAQKPEEDTNAVYRHSAMVQTIARMIHLDVDTTSRLFECINFGIVVLAIGFFLFRWLPKTLRSRSEKVSTDIESARKVTEDAYSRLSAIEAKLSGLDGEIARIRAQVEVESREDEARIKSTIKEESARIVAAAAQEIGSAAVQARHSLRHFAADLAIEQAAKQLAITAETDRALIAEFLGDAAVTGATGNATAKGGRK
jgi:F-type H+-transporting ATPase subunit b